VFSSFDFARVIPSLLFSALVLIAILSGGKGISRVCSFLIPILTISYIIISLYIICSKIELVPDILRDIFKEAFSPRSAVSGFLGYGIMSAMRYGTTRGLLSNEAGCGTSPCAHAQSPNDAHAQGCFGILEVFIDTSLLCTLTALVILLHGKRCENAMELVLNAFSSSLGVWGGYFIFASCLLFAFATVICQYFYGKSSLEFISRKKFLSILYSVIFILVSFISPFISLGVMWQISDLIIAIMAIFNLVFLVILWR
jgi:AGCS family alanine or glycine:cation symporter